MQTKQKITLSTKSFVDILFDGKHLSISRYSDSPISKKDFLEYILCLKLFQQQFYSGIPLENEDECLVNFKLYEAYKYAGNLLAINAEIELKYLTATKIESFKHYTPEIYFWDNYFNYKCPHYEDENQSCDCDTFSQVNVEPITLSELIQYITEKIKNEQ